jgi:hypothetical protein
MNVKKHVARAAIAAAVGMPALALGVGAGAAAADPGQPCWTQNCQGEHRGDGGYDFRGNGGDRQWDDQWRQDQWRQGRDGDQRPWDQRGIDDARVDHHPFNWQGQRVEPYWDQYRGAWGFWFLGFWVAL